MKVIDRILIFISLVALPFLAVSAGFAFLGELAG
jgi:hypothetical protein